MTLEKAYEIGLKYDFTFNGIGPSLCFINNRVGICINLLDNNYGYLKRIFYFDDENSFEKFLKKYKFYLNNKDKNKITISLSDYKIENPEIYYSCDEIKEEQLKITKNNVNKIITNMYDFLNNFENLAKNLENEYINRNLLDQDYHNKLDYYQSLLYKSYDMFYEKTTYNVSDSDIKELNKDVKEFMNLKKSELSHLSNEKNTLDDVEKIYSQLVLDCKNFFDNDKYFNVFFETQKLTFASDLIVKMTIYLQNNPIKTENTELDLKNIKNSFNFDYTLEQARSDYQNKYVELFNKLDQLKTYNKDIFGGKEIIFDIYVPTAKSENNKISDLESVYEKLNDEIKEALVLFYSPLKPIINFLICHAFQKKAKVNVGNSEFRGIYNNLKKIIDNSDNYTIKSKYMKMVSFESYNSFIKSIIYISKLVCNNFLTADFGLKLYTINDDDFLNAASDIPIKNVSNTIKILKTDPGCKFLYSPIKLIIKDEKLKIVKNDNVVYYSNYNTTCVDGEDEFIVSIYEEGLEVMNILDHSLLVVTSFSLDDNISYVDSKLSLE